MMKEIIDVLKKFQQGYDERNLEKVDAFMAEVFSDRQDLLTLGTSTGEVCIGHEEVKKLIYDDWDGGFGDFKIDIENAKIDVDGNAAWFYADCTLKYTFEDSDDKEYERYGEFVREIIEKKDATSKQKLSFLNWALGLHYHQRRSGKREHLWPSEFSGMLVKENDTWKIATLHFALAKPNYPDERFEDTTTEGYLPDANDIRNKIISCKTNKADDELLNLLGKLEVELADDAELGSLHFDSDQVLVFDAGRFLWIMAHAVIKKSKFEDEILDRSLQEISISLDSNLSPEDKLFSVKRTIAYALKEVASGTEFTWPIRLTAVAQKAENCYKFRQKHFSYPFDWIFEGKY